MNFKLAFELMKNGGKVKRPSWGGYWYWDEEKQTIMMHCGPGTSDTGNDIVDIRETKRVEYTIENILANDWIIANEENTPVLGGVTTFGFETAMGYLNRGLKLKRVGVEGVDAIFMLQGNDQQLYCDIIHENQKVLGEYLIRLDDIRATDWTFADGVV